MIQYCNTADSDNMIISVRHSKAKAFHLMEPSSFIL